MESLALHMWATKHTVLNLENQKVRSCKNAGPFPLFPRHDYERSAFTIDCVGDTTKALSKFENQKVGHYKKIGLEPGVRSLKLGPHMPYKPNQGLTCLFAKTGTQSRVARAPFFRRTCSHATTFAEVLRKAMDGSGGNQGAKGGYGRGHDEGARGGRSGGNHHGQACFFRVGVPQTLFGIRWS